MFRNLKIFRRSRVGCLRLLIIGISCFAVFLLMKNLIYVPATNDIGGISSIDYVDDQVVLENDNPVMEDSKTVEIHSNDEFLRRSEKVSLTTEASVVKSPQLTEEKPIDVKEVLERIKKLNNDQKVLNAEKFGKITSNSIVVVVQVHKRFNYLRKLIRSLRRTSGISDALLIFSHDYFSNEINNLVHTIDFCQVVQIYFPYSEQLHPNEFPGTDPNDCPRDQVIPGCNNAHHPDMYGHFREAKFTMTKHHWWWKANRVFQDLHITQNHQGLKLFIEEDHYLAPDFYEVLQKAYSVKKTSQECREMGCDIITLGNYKKLYNFQENESGVIEIRPWKSSEHNMGMAFDHKTWNMITKCSEMFCTYDDYNWDWTLMKMSKTCLDHPLTVVLFKEPRVFHVGTCGLHHKTGSCDVEQVISEVQSLLFNGAKFLYPDSLVLHIARPWIQAYASQPNGGWGDTRDHKLCLKFSHSTE